MQGSMNNVVDISELYNIQRAFFRHQARKSAGSGKVKATLTGTGFMASIPGTALKGQFRDVTVKGNTRYNPLVNGNCEDATNFSGIYATVVNDSTTKVFGNQSVKFTPTGAGTGYDMRLNNDLKDYLNVTKYYLVTAYIKTDGNASTGTRVALCDNIGQLIGVASSYTKSTSWVRMGYCIQPSNFAGRDMSHVYLRCTTSDTNKASVVNVDAFCIEEITSAEYALGVDTLLLQKNYISYGTKSTFSGGGRVKDVGKNQCPTNINDWEQGSISSTTGLNVADTKRIRLKGYITVNPSTQYYFSKVSPYTFVLRVYDINKNFLQSITPSSFTLDSNTHYIRPIILKDDIVNVTASEITTAKPQLEYGATATTWEAHTKTEVYIPPKTGGYKSLPNGENDEFIVSGTDAGKKTQNVSDDYTLLSSDLENLVTTNTNVDIVFVKLLSNQKAINGGASTVGNFNIPGKTEVAVSSADNVANIGKFCISSASGKLLFIVTKGQYANIAAVQASFLTDYAIPASISYQLAQPIVRKYYNLGDDLEGGPGYTVFFEPMANGFKKPAFGTGKITVSTAEYPVTSIKKVVRFDELGDGSIQEVDVTSSAAISDNGTSITITAADYKKVYFYACPYSPELSTAPSYTIEHDVADTNTLGAATHDYGAAAAAWTLTDAESMCGLLTVTNAGGAVDIIAPAHYNMYIIRNASGQAVTIKVSGGTGVAIANTKTAMVIFNGTDYVRISSDV